MDENKKYCIACKKTDEEIPIIQMTYKGKELGICPQHIPLLIHEPTKLVGSLEGAENMKGV